MGTPKYRRANANSLSRIYLSFFRNFLCDSSVSLSMNWGTDTHYTVNTHTHTRVIRTRCDCGVEFDWHWLELHCTIITWLLLAHVSIRSISGYKITPGDLVNAQHYAFGCHRKFIKWTLLCELRALICFYRDRFVDQRFEYERQHPHGDFSMRNSH